MAHAPHRSRPSLARVYPLLAFALVLLFTATASFAYTVHLKDGSKIIAKSKYRIEGDKAFITLPSGTETFLPADQIDVERTRLANTKELGTAIVIEGGKRRILKPGKAYTQPRARRPSDITRTTVGDAGAPTLANWRSNPLDEPVKASSKEALATGALNLATLKHIPLADAELATEIESLLASQGIDAVRVFQGTNSRRPFLRVIAGSEATVFRTLTACASALGQLRENHGNQVEGLELLMLTATRTDAGQFYFTPQLARQLNDKEIEPSEFFLRNVQF